MLHWLNPSSLDLDSRLRPLKVDKDINDMCDTALKYRDSKEICIYFEHPIMEPILEPKIIEVDDIVDSSDGSSSYDDDESAEDELYRPPPPSLENVSDEDEQDFLKKKKT